MSRRWIAWSVVVLLATQLGGTCSGGTGRSSKKDSGCTATSGCSQSPLSVSNVDKIIRQAYAEARANGVHDATIAVVDRVGNVLAVYQMGTGITFDDGVNYRVSTIRSQRSPLVDSGLEGLVVPAALAAITKAGTAAFTASTGGAFTTRTANQITQENFNPGERNRLGGPLFGVQFSQLPCSDFSRRFGPGDGTAGPKRLPLGFTTDPGGVPLYNDERGDHVPVGGVGIEMGVRIGARPPRPTERFGTVTNDPDVFDKDTQLEERIAVAASQGFETPARRRAELIALDGRTLRFTDDENLRSSENDRPTMQGRLIEVEGFYETEAVLAGEEFLTVDSGFTAGTLSFRGDDLDVEQILTPGGAMNAYEPTDSTFPVVASGGLSQNEVTGILFETLQLAETVRGQVRRPLGEPARVNVTVVDAAGVILGFARSPDALVFGADVSVQKARTAAFFSQASVEANLLGAGLDSYFDDTRDFLDDPQDAFTGSIGYSTTSIGGLSRPFFPNGINGNANGPLSRPFDDWSQFSTGLQFDAIGAGILLSICSGDPMNNPAYQGIDDLLAQLGLTCMPASRPTTCTDPSLSGVANGFQIFSGGMPIYRGKKLIGGIGVSGDGAEQDDLIAFLGLTEAEEKFEKLLDRTPPPNGFASPAPANAPKSIRSDQVTVSGDHLRYVRCPVSPFLNSGKQNACRGE